VILFLDIDGVLHPAPLQGRDAGILCHVNRFESIMRDFPECSIVISSGWRLRFDIDALRALFSEGIATRIIGVTPVIALTTSFWRQREIEQYLDNTNHKAIPWIALDDNAGDFTPGLPNLVLCNMTTGIDDVVETQLRFKLGAHGLESEYLDDAGNARTSFANMNRLPSR
jgi:hypothetical protein